jgi:tetratricopeptide (TPR) repeat protein
VAIVDAGGRVAVHTGEGCIAYAGDQGGDGYSAQANMMASPEVWPAMARAYETAVGPLSRRLLAALHAAEAQGGDARGRQSAAIVVAPAEGEPWRTTVDLRVDDHPEPLAELDRLHDLADAYDLATQGDDLAGLGRHDEAGDRYTRAAALAPDNHELLFWAGLAAAQAGDMPLALQRVRRAIELQPGWRDLLGRLQPDIAPAAQAVHEALGEDRAAPAAFCRRMGERRSGRRDVLRPTGQFRGSEQVAGRPLASREEPGGRLTDIQGACASGDRHTPPRPS